MKRAAICLASVVVMTLGLLIFTSTPTTTALIQLNTSAVQTYSWTKTWGHASGDASAAVLYNCACDRN